MSPRQYCALAIALIAGCNFSHGTFAEQKDAAPDDGRLIDGPPTDVKPIDAPPTDPDSDGDGVLDSADNCPAVANANQRNHDGDAKGDACDRCPHLNTPTDPDGDLDGVGDACDPRMSMAGDSIALFEGFYDASSIASWNATGNGNWSVANGVLTQSSTTGSITTHAIGPNINVPRAAVTAGARVIALGTGSGFSAPHVSVASGVTGSQSYWCSVVENSSGNRVYATTIYPPNNENYPFAGWPGTFAANSELRLTTTLIGTTNTCTVVQGATTGTQNGPIDMAAGKPQVATRTASATFDYLFMVSIGN